MANGHYQPTSAPYNADNLKPHDTDLVWTQEFGTETTENVGQSFVTSDAGGSSQNIVDARTGMLQVRSVAPDPDSMTGTTFLIPPWSTYAESPIIGPQGKAIMLFAHFLLPESNVDDPAGTAALLVLAAEDFVGFVDGKNCSAVAIKGSENPDIGEEADILIQSYGNGADDSPTDEEDRQHWGTNLYIRMLIVTDTTDEEKESDAFVWSSRDGLSWTLLGNVQITADGQFRRIGLGISGAAGMAALDWVRIYSYPLSGFQEDGGVFTPVFPVTGDRRY